MRKITRIVIHCSATPPTMNIGVEEIRQWHIARGWSDIGYHYVITRNGTVEPGRPIKRPGAHVKGHNRDSIGICLVGGINEKGKPDSNFTFAQFLQLDNLICRLEEEYGKLEILGHRDLPEVSKDCPCFDVKSFMNR